MFIYECLPFGESSTISTADLLKRVNLKNARELQREIETERNAGYIICSSWRGGYYRHENAQEHRAYVRTQENRARNTFRSLNGARKALRELEKAE